ncbi:MAG: 50S ribosomal protein L24 [Candidatus Woykebacteria bacterium]
MKIKTGDQVLVLVGKDKGKKGKVEKSLPKINKVLVGGINVYKKHQKPQGKTLQGGIIDLAKPINVTNVALICPKCNLPTKVSYRTGDKKKDRICKKCKQVIE